MDEKMCRNVENRVFVKIKKRRIHFLIAGSFLVILGFLLFFLNVFYMLFLDVFALIMFVQAWTLKSALTKAPNSVEFTESGIIFTYEDRTEVLNFDDIEKLDYDFYLPIIYPYGKTEIKGYWNGIRSRRTVVLGWIVYKKDGSRRPLANLERTLVERIKNEIEQKPPSGVNDYERLKLDNNILRES
ncbi:MAG: hypothetical protein Q7J68_01890 [Thermoplasmata archaeon]|nr:hypothetical protein [Thermoplasmata archaeon]